ncbi:MAG: type II toxin-antitoxin system VapC family toxin [bacterium]|nr:type II toxin-antitoxin system VapC family toxin [bacterium]
MNSARVHFIDQGRDTADFYAQIFNNLKRKGTPIPTNDIWIAASAMQNGLALFSLDNHFLHIDGLILQPKHTAN